MFAIQINIFYNSIILHYRIDTITIKLLFLDIEYLLSLTMNHLYIYLTMIFFYFRYPDYYRVQK